MFSILFLLGAAVAALAQPSIPPGAIVNEASLTPAGLPAAGIARGSRFQISGANLGPAVALEQKTFPLSTALGGVTVTVTAGGVTRNCWPVYVQSGVIRAVLPSAVPAGPASVMVNYSGQNSNRAFITVVDHAPGIFTVNKTGYGPGVIHNFASANVLVSSMSSPGRPNMIASLLATGFGASTAADDVAPAQQNLPASYNIDLQVAGVSVTKLFAGRSTTNPGMDQIVFRVPPTVPFGCYVPVQAVVNGVPGNVVTMAISATGAACSDAANPVSSALRTGGNVAVATVNRGETNVDGTTVTIDRGHAVGRTVPANAFAFDRALSLPPAGSCTAYVGKGSFANSPVVPELGGTNLNLGSVSVKDPSNTSKLLAFLGTHYESLLGAQNAAINPSPGPPFLNPPGPFVLQGGGGGGIGNFSTSASIGAIPTWTNAASLSAVTRTAGATLSWTGAGARQVFIIGGAYSEAADATTGFICMAPIGASSFTVPSVILRLLPPVTTANGVPRGVLGVGAFQDVQPNLFFTGGINFGAFILSNHSVQAVLYQ